MAAQGPVETVRALATIRLQVHWDTGAVNTPYRKTIRFRLGSRFTKQGKLVGELNAKKVPKSTKPAVLSGK